ncbi:MAG TPA: hypothetical protein VF092_26455 [Longimicrobium sp.]
MAKMKLDVDALQVESFNTASSGSPRGTVHARSGDTGDCEAAFITVTDWKTCQGADCTARTLCHYSCLGECYAVDQPVVAGVIVGG